MNILVVSDYYQPVIGYAKPKIIEALQKKGHKVSVLTSDRYFPFHNYEVTSKKLLGNRIRSVGTKKEYGVKVIRKKALIELFTRVYFEGLEKELTKINPDHVIVFGISSPSAYRVAKLKSKLDFTLTVVDSHLPSEFEHGAVVLKKVIYGLFRILFSPTISDASDKVIALQKKTVDVIQNIYGIEKHVDIVPNGTDTTLFEFNASEGKKIRKKLNIASKDFTIIYTGKIISQKGVHLLCQASSRLMKQKKNVHLVLVGDGPKEYLKKCKSYFTKSQLEHVHFEGFKDQKELANYYSASNIGVWTLQESLAMIDAAACSIPFIANSDLAGTVRVEADNALLYNKGDVSDLYQQLKYAYEHATELKKMGKRGRKLVEKKLSWDALCLQFLP